MAANLTRLDPWDPSSGALNVIVETSKGSRNKLKYDPEQGLFELSKVLPLGMIFPFDFGFIPSTIAGDGDPLDVLVLLDERVPAGCKIPARLIGVIEAEQIQDGQTQRNDRIVAVAQASHEHRDIRSLKDFNEHLLKAIERFFVSYNEMMGKQFKPLGHYGPHRAEKLVQQAIQRCRGNNGQNGQALNHRDTETQRKQKK